MKRKLFSALNSSASLFAFAFGILLAPYGLGFISGQTLLYSLGATAAVGGLIGLFG